MLQQRQIIRGLGKQIDREDLAGGKYPIRSFQSIDWIFIFVNVS